MPRFLAGLTVFVFAILLQPYGGGQICAQDLFAFPADDVISPNLENARNRTPVYIPGKCSPNEILYPGDHESDWVCDCRPGYVYSPIQDSCYPLFQQGFCQPGEYVGLARPSMIVKCIQNTCSIKNEVPYMGRCVKLHQNNGQCKIEKSVSWVIAVNITTLELDCVQGTTDMLEVWVSSRTMDDEDEEPTAVYFQGAKLCTIGKKAMGSPLCRETK